MGSRRAQVSRVARQRQRRLASPHVRDLVLLRPMETNHRFTAGVLAVVAALGPLAIARADDKGDAVLARVDRRLVTAKPLELEYEIVTKESDKAERKLAMRLTSADDKWLAEFLAPPDMKGTKILFLSSTQLYVYLP